MALPGDLIRLADGTLRFGDLAIDGVSTAGEETWFRVRPPGIAFDAGLGSPRLAGVADVFLSHGHLDHVAGVPFVLSQRAMQQAGETRIHCPAAIAERLEALLEAASALEERRYRRRVVGLAAGDRVELGADHAIEAFATDHPVPSLGYHLLRRRRKLAVAHRGRDAEEIIALRRAGVEVSDSIEDLRLTYCGDTGPGVFDSEPRLFEAPLLLLECTFLGHDTRGRGERFGHLHADDLIERAVSFRNQVVVLHHLSRRHRAAELRGVLTEAAPELAARVHLLGEP